MILGLANSLFRLFRENSDVIPVSRLKKQGVKSVTVLDWERIESLINRAVREALSRHGVDLSERTLASVNQEAREAFARLVEQRDAIREERDTLKRTARTLEVEREELAANLDALHQELYASTGALAHERRHTVSAENVTVDPKGIAQYAARLERELRRMLRSGEGDGSEGDLAASVTALARRLLNDERKGALETARKEQVHRIEKLERRIAKLKGMLSESEQLVGRLRGSAQGADDEGVESIYREIQGMDGDDVLAAEKQGLLDEIFRLNVELREVIQETMTTETGKRD
ncbi:MAG: hypothetical protein V2A76_06010 [Planctomycetota bacterium]